GGGARRSGRDRSSRRRAGGAPRAFGVRRTGGPAGQGCSRSARARRRRVSTVPEPLVELAPAKVNLVLQVGPRRDDGLHELCSLFASLELADTLRFEVADADDGQDEVHCPGVEGPNLITAALGAYRDTVPDAVPSLWVTVNKRI